MDTKYLGNILTCTQVAGDGGLYRANTLSVYCSLTGGKTGATSNKICQYCLCSMHNTSSVLCHLLGSVFKISISFFVIFWNCYEDLTRFKVLMSWLKIKS